MEIKLCINCNKYQKGTWRCMAPEAVRSQSPMDGSTDRWFAENFRIYGACGRRAQYFEPIPPPLTFREQWDNFLSLFSRKK